VTETCLSSVLFLATLGLLDEDQAGDAPPGPNETEKDIVMMDDFLYGEPTLY